MEKITITVPTVPKVSIKVPGSGSDGTTDHSRLENLKFENSGHTGFQRELAAEQLANIDAVPSISKKVEQLTEQAGNTYTKTEVNELISRIPKMSFEVWSGTLDELLALSEEEISDTTIYLVSKESGTHNIYAEYIYINGVWEKLGDLDVDLTGYATKEEVEATEQALEGQITALTPTVITDVSGSIVAVHNTHIVEEIPLYNGVYELYIGLFADNIPNVFECSVYIKPREEAPVLMSSHSYIQFFGDDCDETGVFTPQANTHYEISFKRMGSDDSGNPLIIARVGAWQ